ncbi:MAG: glycerate kinase [Pseudobacter sp.]|uniref:glycerate kinase n=1 Tax=Pseudobacter sp. TaxID=2045420 RepID=UPI003F80A76F
MHILIAPNSFKNSLDANDVAAAIREGLERSSLEASYELFPVADGGDGTAPLLMKHLNARSVALTVHGPKAEEVKATYGWLPSTQTAIIEMAAASGLRLLPVAERDPLHCSSNGTGELMLDGLNRGATSILLCIGGSATVDGGSGILQALGYRFLDKNDNELLFMPERLQKLATIDDSKAHARLRECSILILCDVKNRLLGEQGASRVFGPQKGADKEGVEKLEAAMQQFRDVVLKQFGKDMAAYEHGGAAGGTAAGLAAVLDAELRNGTDEFLEMTNFDKALKEADLVITGEGSLDEQTLQGKAPFGVAVRAGALNIPVVGLAGRVPMHQEAVMEPYFDAIFPIGNEPSELEEAFRNTRVNLVRTANQLGNLLALQKGKNKKN